MKPIALSFLTILALALPALAADEHQHETKEAGPNGGRVLTAVQPPLEFFVTADRKVEITALTTDFKAGKLRGQIIAVTAGDRSHPTKLELKEEAGKLVSSNPLPAGHDIPVSVSIKADAQAKATYAKFNLNLAPCPTCQHPEYACLCPHGHEEK